MNQVPFITFCLILSLYTSKVYAFNKEEGISVKTGMTIDVRYSNLQTNHHVHNSLAKNTNTFSINKSLDIEVYNRANHFEYGGYIKLYDQVQYETHSGNYTAFAPQYGYLYIITKYGQLKLGSTLGAGSTSLKLEQKI